MFAFAHQLCDSKKQLRAFVRGDVSPGLKSFIGSLDSAIRKFFRSFMKSSDDLSTICGIDAFEGAARFNALAADDQRILATKFALNCFDRAPHGSGVFFFREIG